MNKYSKKVIGVAFGDPMAHKTFSGYSRHLFDAIGREGVLSATLSSRLIKPVDILSGCVNFNRLLELKKPDISAKWLWDPVTIGKFSRRLAEKLNEYPQDASVLQVGTHVYPYKTSRNFYCVTDMTVKQAMEAGQFKIRHLTSQQVDKAIGMQKQMFEACEKIFVLCQWTKASVVEDYGQDDKKVVVIGAGANIGQIEPAENKYTSGEILFVGYDWVRKGGPLLLEAFTIVRRKINNAVLNIVGCSPCVRQAGVNVVGSLSRYSKQDRAKLEQLYKGAQCFCILPQFDPFPNVLLEAQITGTPVVSLKNGSRLDAVRDGQTALLVEKADAAEVADALIHILSNSDMSRSMGNAAKKFVLENFTWPIIAQKVLGQMCCAKVSGNDDKATIASCIL